MQELTEKQRKFFNFYKDKKNWNPPTWKQLREHMGLKSDQSVNQYFGYLREKGYL